MVPDLTQLAANNDGEFPMLQAIHVIDGRTGLRAHGGPMPVYGALFTEESGSGTKYGDDLFTRGKVLAASVIAPAAANTQDARITVGLSLFGRLVVGG